MAPEGLTPTPASTPPASPAGALPSVSAEQRAVELEALRQVSLSLSAGLELGALLDTLLESALRLLPQAGRADVFVYQGGRLTHNASHQPGGRRGPAPNPPRPNGLTYTVARSGQRLAIGNMREHVLFRGLPEVPMAAIIGLPLRAKGRVVGVMNISYPAPRVFAAAELHWLDLLGDQAAAAIENAWLFEATRRQVRELTVLHQVATAGAEATDEDALIARATTIIGHQLFPDAFGVLLLDEQAGMLRLHASYQGLEPGTLAAIPIGQGVTGRVAATGQPWNVPDTALEPAYQRYGRPMLSELCVPLRAGERVLGVVNAESATAGAFSETHERLLLTLAGQLATALDRLRAEAAERRATLRAAESRAVLYRASQEIAGSLDPDEVYAATHRAVAELMVCEVFLIALVDEAGQEVELAYVVDRGRRAGPGHEQFAASLSAHVIQAGNPLRVERLSQLSALGAQDVGDADHVQSLVAAPLRSGAKVFGMLSAQSYQPSAFTPEDEQTLGLLANQAAVAIEHARLFTAEREQRQLAEVLRESGASLSASLEIETVLDQLLEQVARVVPYDTAAILLREGDAFRAARWQGYAGLRPGSEDEIQALRLPVSETANLRQILATGAPMIVSDTRDFPGWVAVRAAAHIRSWLGAPLIAQGETIAIFALDKREPNFYHPRHARHLATFAGQAALAVKNAQLFDRERKRVAALTALHDTGLDLSRQLELKMLLRTIVERARALLEAGAGGLYLALDDNTLECAVSVGYQRDMAGQHLQPGEGIAGQVMVTGQPALTGDYVHLNWPSAEFAPEGVQSVIAAPIRWQQRTTGVLAISDGRPHRFGTGDIELVRLFADQAAVAIVNARLFAALEDEKRRLELLFHLSQRLTASLDLDEVAGRALELLCSTLQAERAELYLPAAAPGLISLSAASGVPMSSARGMADRLAREAAETRQLAGWRAAGSADEAALSAAALPLLLGDTLVGVCVLLSRRADMGAAALHPHLLSVAAPMALALQNAQLFAAEARRAHYLECLNAITHAAVSALDFRRLLETMAEHLTSMLAADAAYLMLWDDARAVPIPAAAFGVRQAIGLAADIQPGDPTLTETVLRANQALVVTTNGAEPAYRDLHLAACGLHSGLALPLTLSERKLGAAVVAFRGEHSYSAQDIAYAEQAARQMALGLARAQLFDDARRRAEELAILVEVTGALRAARTTADMLPIFLRKACDITGAVGSAIFLIEDGTGDLVLRASHPPNPRLVGLRHKPGEGITGRVAASGEPHFSVDINADPLAVIETTSEREFLQSVRSAMALPLHTQEGIIGVMHVGVDRPRSFSATERHLVTTVAEVAGNALQRANLLETLEQRVEARTRELASANARLQELDRLKDQFISNVSHELRTPLTNIKLHLSLLDKRGAEVLPRYLPTLQRETERLRRLIDDLLDLSRLQAQIAPPRRGRHLADALIAEVIALHATRAEARGLALVHDIYGPSLEFHADRAQMLQVFTNLLANAVAYTPPGGRVRVGARPAARNGRAGLEARFYNSGGPIPADDLPHLFERFFRGRTGVESGEAGTGLGLAICREIVEQHGGEISVTSTSATGTLFTVWLPLGE